MRLVWLGLALVPYAVLVGIDTWLHERSRCVPRFEQVLHVGLAIVLLAFFLAVFDARTALAFGTLCVFAVLAGVDEFGFHGKLATRERRVHFASYLALFAFVLTWQWLGEVP